MKTHYNYFLVDVVVVSGSFGENAVSFRIENVIVI